jgi:hypothetical protein
MAAGLLPKVFGQSGNFEVIFFGILLILVLQRARDGLWPWLARLVPVQGRTACRRRRRAPAAARDAGRRRGAAGR